MLPQESDSFIIPQFVCFIKAISEFTFIQYFAYKLNLILHYLALFIYLFNFAQTQFNPKLKLRLKGLFTLKWKYCRMHLRPVAGAII